MEEAGSNTRTVVVIANATPARVAAIGAPDRIAIRENKLGTLVTGRPGDLVIDYAAELEGPVYDVIYNADTGWFAVTVYHGLEAKRWDNRPSTNAGYPRLDDVLGAVSPTAILERLDIPPQLVGYAPA